MSKPTAVESSSLPWRLLRGLAIGLAWSARPSMGAASSSQPWVADTYGTDGRAASQAHARRGLQSELAPPRACTNDRVALLVLSTGQFDQADAWEPWFEQAGELVSLAEQRAEGCDKARLSAALSRQRRAQRDSAHLDAIARQSLFSVQVHVPAELDFDPNTLWGRYVIEERLDTQWGDYSLVDATRALMRVALASPCNRRFMLLSEDSAPLYPPAVLHQASLNSQLSRINACSSSRSSAERWDPRMATGASTPVSLALWRKSSQWWDLRRDHVELLVADQAIDRAFRLYCRGDSEPPCAGDEHYFPTALAMLGRSDETDCAGLAMATRWESDSWHPHAYAAHEASAALLRHLREGAHCGADLANGLAAYAFASAHQSLEQAQLICGLEAPWSPLLIDADCPTLARKFPQPTAAPLTLAVRQVLRRHHAQHMNLLLPERLNALRGQIAAFEGSQRRFSPLPTGCVASQPTRDWARGVHMDFACPPPMPVERSHFEAMRCFPEQELCEAEVVSRADMTSLDEAFERTLNGVDGLREGIDFLNLLLRRPGGSNFAHVGRRILDELRRNSATLANFCTEADALSAKDLATLVEALWLRVEDPVAPEQPPVQLATGLHRIILRRGVWLQMLLALARDPDAFLRLAPPASSLSEGGAQLATGVLRLLATTPLGDLEDSLNGAAGPWQALTVEQAIGRAGVHLAVVLPDIAPAARSADGFAFVGAIMARAWEHGEQRTIRLLRERLAAAVAKDVSSAAPFMLRQDLARVCDLLALFVRQP